MNDLFDMFVDFLAKVNTGLPTGMNLETPDFMDFENAVNGTEKLTLYLDREGFMEDVFLHYAHAFVDFVGLEDDEPVFSVEIPIYNTSRKFQVVGTPKKFISRGVVS